MAKIRLGDVALVIGIALVIVALPTVYSWYLDLRDGVRSALSQSGQA